MRSALACLKFAWIHLRGKAIGIFACVCMTMIFCLVKITKLPPLVPFLYRGLFAANILLLIVIYSCGYDGVRQIQNNWKLLGLRSATDAAAAALFYSSLAYFPLTEIGFLTQTQTAFTMIVAFIVLREKPSLFQILCAIGAMIGAILVIQPPVLGFPSKSTTESESDFEANMRFYVGCGVITFALLMFAVGGTIMRKLSTSGQIHWATTAMVQALFCVGFGVIGLIVTGDTHFVFFVCESEKKVAILSIALLSCTLQMCFFFCLKYEKASMLSILVTIQVLFMPIGDLVVFGKLPHLNIFHLSGFILITVSILSLFIAKHLAAVAKQKEAVEKKENNCFDLEGDSKELKNSEKENNEIEESNQRTSET